MLIESAWLSIVDRQYLATTNVNKECLAATNFDTDRLALQMLIEHLATKNVNRECLASTNADTEWQALQILTQSVWLLENIDRESGCYKILIESLDVRKY